ncbi:TRAP transporter large permease subunit [Paramesorhizobium deserti]|uniref:TRAP transporter large permease subunit n=1 Tax=Paramesorhizobium deserti TaxID=1494590 RepID=UPI000B2F3314|nr:TRAP transporter large permease subunit [Paramesorhizobium deserti]
MTDSDPEQRLGRYIETPVAGEIVRAFVPPPLPPKPQIDVLALLDRLSLAERAHRRLSLRLLSEALSRTASMSGNILFVVFTSMIFAYATALSGVGETLVAMLETANVSRLTFLLIVMVTFAILGCFMEGLGMIAIIVPVIFPALMALNVDPIWFGVFVVILVELGQLTPPLGVILFVVASSSDKVKVGDVIMGTLPFFTIILIFMLLLIAFPQIALFLPSITAG